MIKGTCLCGAVSWNCAPIPDAATACNCTACRRYGTLWAYGFEEEGIEVSGPTRAYVRGEVLEFHFCPGCGCVAYWRAQNVDDRGRRHIAVNLRLADPKLVEGIVIDHFDGLESFDDLPRDGRCVKDMW